MAKWKAGVVGAAVGVAIYHAISSTNKNIPRLVPEVVLDADVSENKEILWAIKSCGREDFELVKILRSEEPDIVSMALHLRNVGGSEAHNVKVADVKVAKERARFAEGYDIPVIAAGGVTDPLIPNFGGLSGLFANDFTTKAYTQVLHERRNIREFTSQWEKRRANLMERAAKAGEPDLKDGWSNNSHDFYAKELLEYIESFQSSADYVEDRKYPASAQYEDRHGRKYVVEWEYTFHPINHFMLWEKLVMGYQDAHAGEGGGMKPLGPCLTISSFRNRRL